jgi:hypothetical protein
MAFVYRSGHHLVTQYTTGPQTLLLRLDLQRQRIGEPVVTALRVCRIYGNVLYEVVRAAAVRGADEANADFGTHWHPLEIQYSYSGYDTKHCKIMEQAAYNIVKEIAECGVDDLER